MAYDGILADPTTVTEYKTMPPPSYKELVDFYTKAKVPPIVWGMDMGKAPTPYMQGCDCALCRTARGEMKAGGVVDKNALSVLKKARAYIAYAWCQNAMQSGNQVCAVGAIVAAIQGRALPDSMPRDVVLALEGIVRHLPGINSPSELIRFNDLPSTTQKDVLRLFDRGIAALENPEPRVVPERQSFSIMDVFA